MKLIHSFDISEGMSVNSLKPSINAGPESSLDSCIMKEASVGDCLLPKEMHSQNNGQKGLCLADYDVGNGTKKMFEQVDLNSSLPNSEVPLRKDSWSSGAMYDKSSEKENMEEANEVNFDILSDDDSHSLHLKISSDEENSNEDSEVNEQNTSSIIRLHNNLAEDDTSQDTLEHDNEDLHSGIPVYGQNPNDYSESDKELLNESVTTEGEQGPLESIEESGTINTQSTESDIEDTTEEFGPIPSSSKSPEVSLSPNVHNILGKMVNEDKFIAASPTEVSSGEDVSDLSNSKLEESNERSSLKTLLSFNEKESRTDSEDPKNNISEGVESYEHFEREINALQETKEMKDGSDEELAICSFLRTDKIKKREHDEVVVLEEDIKSNVVGVNNAEIMKAQIDENIYDDVRERMDCDDEQEGKRRFVCDGEVAEYSESSEMEELINEKSVQGNLVKENNRNNIINPLENQMSVEDNSNTTESKVIEILEYQPVSDEGEEMTEVQLEKDVLCPTNQCETMNTGERSDELLHASELCSEKKTVDNRVPSVLLKCDSKDSGMRISSDGDVILVRSPESLSTRCLGNERDYSTITEQSNIINKNKILNRDENNVHEQQKIKVFEKNDCSETNSVSGIEEDSDIKLISRIGSAKKMEPEAEHCQVQLGRKRTSNSEETLVNSSKRTKVAIPETENDNDCDVFMCEKTIDSEYRKCMDSNAKEKCDSGIKRLSNSVSDTTGIKKGRVATGSDRDKKDEESTFLDDVQSDNVKKSASVDKLQSEIKTIEDVKPLPFFRNFSRGQLEKLTRNDLEELVLQKICEAITERSKCGELREIAQSLEQKLRSWQKKCTQLAKQIKDLNAVLKRYGSDLQTKPHPVPLKITRSVGLQVQMPGYAPLNGCQEDSIRRRTDKAQSSVSTPSSPSMNATIKSGASSPVSTKSSSNAQKSEGNEGQVSPVSSPPHPQLNAANTLSVGVLQNRPSLVTSGGTANANKASSKLPPNPVNSKVKSMDLQVIDLTDAEDKSKDSTGHSSAVSNLPSASSTQTLVAVSTAALAPAAAAPAAVAPAAVAPAAVAPAAVVPAAVIPAAVAPAAVAPTVSTIPTAAGITTTVATLSSAPVTTSTIASNVNSSSVNNVGCRSIRVVQHVSGTTAPLLTPSCTNTAGQRVTYFVPTSSVPVQPRQLIISSPSQVRPTGVVSVANRQNSISTIVLKPGQVVPVSPVTGSASNIIRGPSVNSSVQLASTRSQPRPGQLFQRIPTGTNPVQSSLVTSQSSILSVSSVSHPAPLPPTPATVPNNAQWKLPPPKPDLKISKVPNRNQQGIVLSWNMAVSNEYEEIASYQLFAYQEGSAPPSTQFWKKVGDVRALPLPMACTLTQFMEGHKYHFAVRAVDVYARYGPFSAPGNIVLTRN